MISFLKKICSVNIVESSKELVKYIKDTSKLSEEINLKKQEMDHVNYNYYLENKEDMYISLSDFMNLVETPNLSTDILISKCRHVSELGGMKSSTIDVFTIIEDDHVILCPDVNNCEKHKGYVGSKIRITTVRR